MRVFIGVDGCAGSIAAVRFAGGISSADKDEQFLYYSPPSRTYVLEDTSGLLDEAQTHDLHALSIYEQRVLGAHPGSVVSIGIVGTNSRQMCKSGTAY